MFFLVSYVCLLNLHNEGLMSHYTVYTALLLLYPHLEANKITQDWHFEKMPECVCVCAQSGAQTLHLAVFCGPVCFCLGSFVHVTLWLTETMHMGHSPINIKVGQRLFLGEAAWQIVFMFMIHTSPY